MRNPIMWIAMNIFVRDSWEWVRDLPRFEAQKLSTSLKPNSFPPQIQKKNPPSHYKPKSFCPVSDVVSHY